MSFVRSSLLLRIKSKAPLVGKGSWFKSCNWPKSTMRYLSNRKVPFKRHYQAVSFVFLFLFEAQAQKAQQENMTGERRGWITVSFQRSTTHFGLLIIEFIDSPSLFKKYTFKNICNRALCIFPSFCVCITNVFCNKSLVSPPNRQEIKWNICHVSDRSQRTIIIIIPTGMIFKTSHWCEE